MFYVLFQAELNMLSIEFNIHLPNVGAILDSLMPVFKDSKCNKLLRARSSN